MWERRMGMGLMSPAPLQPCVLRAGGSCHAPQSNLTPFEWVLSSGVLVNV